MVHDLARCGARDEQENVSSVLIVSIVYVVYKLMINNVFKFKLELSSKSTS